MKKGNVVEINGVKQPQLNLPELLDMHRKPLTLEEIKPNMWVWDSVSKEYALISYVKGNEICINYICKAGYVEFTNNRYYRYQPLEV